MLKKKKRDKHEVMDSPQTMFEMQHECLMS